MNTGLAILAVICILLALLAGFLTVRLLNQSLAINYLQYKHNCYEETITRLHRERDSLVRELADIKSRMPSTAAD